jgi:putative oxidoreductase
MCPETIIKTLIALFFAITFLQSGIDKVINKDGNLDWFKSVFENTFLSKIITPLFYWITIQEIAVGIIMVIAALCFSGIMCENCIATEWGYVLCVFILLQLFTGQRIAKDYVGATGIIPYIAIALIGFLFFNGCGNEGTGEDASACQAEETVIDKTDSITVIK